MNKWENTKPHINVGTLGHRNHRRVSVIAASLKHIPPLNLNITEDEEIKNENKKH